MLKFAYTNAVDIYRRAKNFGSGSFSVSTNELNEYVYGDVTTNWVKISASMPCRIERPEKTTEYLATGERNRFEYLMYADFSDSQIYMQDRIVDLTDETSTSMFIVDYCAQKSSMTGKISHYEIGLTGL